jgi:hypothetical protein
MHPIARNEDQQYDSEDEISIIDILRFFIDGWKAMLSFTVIGALLGISYVAIGTPQYKATAIIVPAFANGTQVETLVDLRRKLKIPTYYSSETYRACGLEDAVTNGSALAETLVPTLKKDEALDQIEFISKSNDTNTNCLNSVLEDIRIDHADLAEPIIKASSAKLNGLKQRLFEASALRDLYNDRILNMSLVNLNNFPAGILFYKSAMTEADTNVANLTNQINDLTTSFTEPHTRPTKFVKPIFTSNIQIDSKKMMKVMAAIFIGLFFSIIYLVGKKYSAKLKEISKPTE